MFKQEMTVTAAVENLAAVTAFVDEALERYHCSPRSRMQLDVALDELFSNIAYYAYQPGQGPVTLVLEIGGEPPAAALTFIDQGTPYNPLEHQDPDTTLSAQERQIGGLGILMVKKTMDQVAYRYAQGKNILRIEKKL